MEELRQARLNQELRLKDVAERADCSISLVHMVERGYVAATAVRSRIAVAVGASLGYFWPEAR